MNWADCYSAYRRTAIAKYDSGVLQSAVLSILFWGAVACALVR
jgi:hypothetical protein